MLADDDARGILTHVQSKLKAASSHCQPGTFDLHVLPNVGWEVDAAGRRTGRHELSLIPVLLQPRGTAACGCAAPTRRSCRRSTRACSAIPAASTSRS